MSVKISNLTELSAANIAALDLSPVVDVSATTSGSKKMYAIAQALGLSKLLFFEDTGGDDAYVISTGLTLTTLNAGFAFALKVATGNNGACTLAVDSAGAKSIKVVDASGVRDPLTGEIAAGMTAMLSYNGTYFILLNPAYLVGSSASYFDRDDFDRGSAETTGTVGAWNWAWVTSGTGSFTVDYEAHTAVATAFGVARFARAAGTGAAWIYPSHWSAVGASATKGLALGNTPGLQVEFRLALGTAATTGKTLRIGLLEAYNASGQDDGIFFECVDLGNWQAKSTAASTTNTVDTGIAQSTSFVKFKFIVASDGLSIDYYINDVLVATSETHIPTVCISPFMYLSHDTNAQNWDMDYFAVTIPGAR